MVKLHMISLVYGSGCLLLEVLYEMDFSAGDVRLLPRLRPNDYPAGQQEGSALPPLRHAGQQYLHHKAGY